MKLNRLKNRVPAVVEGKFIRYPQHKLEDIDYQLDNFFLGLKLYSNLDAGGIRYMLGAIHDLAFCEMPFEEFIITVVDKYRIDIDKRIVEEICSKKK